MKSLNLLLSLSLLLSLLSSCGSLEQEIDVDLDDYESRLVVEGYLEPGKQYNLLLSRSSNYFAPIDVEAPLESLLQQLEENAEVFILHRGDTIVLENQLSFDVSARSFANYVSDQVVPEHYNEPFELHIRTDGGEQAFATTRILPPIPIDSVVIETQENDTLYRALTYFTDDTTQPNFVRRILHINTLDSIDQDFITDDRFVESASVVFGTGYTYSQGDTLINSLYHIEEAYYEFLISVFGSLNANGNPFAQPGRINSNVTGSNEPTGIFTGLSYDRVETVIE